MSEPTAGLTLDAAVARARAIERDLAAGRLTVPYPPEVRADLVECARTFVAWCTTPERTLGLARRLDAGELPW